MYFVYLFYRKSPLKMVDFAFKEFVHEKYTFYRLFNFIQKN